MPAVTNDWDRQRTADGTLEPARWFGRFEIYRLLGSDRTIEEAWRQWKNRENPQGQGKRPSKQWYDTARLWNWRLRAEAWDVYMVGRLAMENERKWLARQEAIREWEWEIHEKLKSRVGQMLGYPLAQVTVGEDGGTTTTVIEPVGWRHTDIVRFALASSELGRLSAELETKRDVVEMNITARQFLEALPPSLREQVRLSLLQMLERHRENGSVDVGSSGNGV